MGKRGPKPAPTPLKVVRGDRKSRVNTAEPKPSASSRIPVPSAGMSEAARAVWKRLAAELHRRQILTSWDRDAFAVYCEAVVVHREASKRIAREGLSVMTKAGKQRNPDLITQKDAAQTMLRAAQEFGLTPVARAQLKTPEGDADEALRLLS